MSKKERQNQIIEKIQSNNQMSASTLANQLGVSKRTILRDIDDLEKQGVRIIARYGVHGGYQIAEAPHNYALHLTEDQLIALFLVLNESQSYSSLPFKDDIKPIIQQCLNLPYTKLRSTLKKLDKYIKFEDYSETLLPQFYTDILIYSMERNVMSIEYRTRKDTSQTENVIFIGMVCKQGVWNAVIFEIGTGKTNLISVIDIEDISYSFEKKIQTHDITLNNYQTHLKET
ncbi:HTH domain-containing protein [Staphylococcus sp. SQ8-PEA]|uniref:HTH domain-containing protein n=1 Tax=Staphylococcus marylandisciuri TaxID=2981529 RepID=A0ABT2QMK4_9STAP|nr:HTH domain-containing protein [Staphylococcus marylandisciuri]MCU5745216.1 HTH domain-containing protein [Staphylococcus marylandisciuri]